MVCIAYNTEGKYDYNLLLLMCVWVDHNYITRTCVTVRLWFKIAFLKLRVHGRDH